jgi:ribose 5-phosphate isomerase A
MTADSYKRAAAARAINFVRSGMRLGLGTGSTAQHFVELLAERVRAGLDVIAVPTSEERARKPRDWALRSPRSTMSPNSI